jgi:hypothetical protein
MLKNEIFTSLVTLAASICLYCEKYSLTLIEPGEVKVDLANFELKLQENFISTSQCFLNLFLHKRLPDLFELLT